MCNNNNVSTKYCYKQYRYIIINIILIYFSIGTLLMYDEYTVGSSFRNFIFIITMLCIPYTQFVK